MRKLTSMEIAMVVVGFCSMAYAFDPKAEGWDQEQVLAVKNPEGEYLGSVKDLLLSFSGTIAFFIISAGENGEKDVVVPVGIFSYDMEKEVLILNISRERLRAAPEFNVKGIYEFFGVVPPWTEETPQDSGKM